MCVRKILVAYIDLVQRMLIIVVVIFKLRRYIGSSIKLVVLGKLFCFKQTIVLILNYPVTLVTKDQHHEYHITFDG